MCHPACTRIVLTLAIAVALAGFAQVLYGQARRTPLENDRGLTFEPGKAREAARVSHSEREDPWTADEVIEPDALAKALSGAAKPMVIQVGIVHLYRLGHIPGSKYAGPANSAEGLDMLKKLVAGIPRTSEIVYYCGCCPWKDCPNIRPAHTTLKEMGFKKIRILNIPNNFSEDWASKGLPTEKGGA